MFTIYDQTQGFDRRAFLRIGTLGLGGLALSRLLSLQAAAGESKSPLAGKSVIFLFQHGGPSQFETFDPKMTAPEGVRSTTGEIATALPGITFGSTFAKLARLADKLAVVRSYVPGDANHDAKPIVHRETRGGNLGSYYSRVVGTNHPLTGLPTNVTLYPRAVDAKAQTPAQGLGNFLATGPLGSAYTPFVPGADGNLQKDMLLKVPRERLDDRRLLMASFDNLKQKLDASGTVEAMDRFRSQAFDVILRGAAQALDLTREDPKTIARYDTAPLVPADSINKKWNNHKYYADHSRTLGKLLLFARRLCEAGCGFVTINTQFVWDMHADVNNASVKEGMGYVGQPFDHAVAAFIEDVEARGLSERILLVACGEMGRTPRINKNGGRDHWGNLGPLLFYGGGLKMGQVIGRSTANGGDPASDPIRIPNVIATIMHTLFDVGQVRLMPGIGNDVIRVITQGEPIPQLMS
jgi:hypothetical protein